MTVKEGTTKLRDLHIEKMHDPDQDSMGAGAGRKGDEGLQH
jgi:hypothetical protein